MSKEIKLLPGRGLDIGTGFLVSSQMDEDGNMHTKSVRDAFLEITPPNKMIYGMIKKSLQKSGVSFFEEDGTLSVLGDDSLLQSVEKGMLLKRPMEKGVISRTDTKALPMFKALLRELLGPPLVEGERIVYSVPASPLDAPFDIVYHESVLEAIFKSLGYTATSINEAQAIVFSELAEEDSDYTGVAVSFGAGMTNFSISKLAESLTAFAVAKGGDHIDFGAATSLGFDPKDPKASEYTPNMITYIKEQGVDIAAVDSSDKVKGAIAAHYRNLIKHVVDTFVKHVNSLEQKPKFLEPITIVISGGTSLAPGFIQVFEEQLNGVKSKLPFEIKKVVHASQPLTAVAQGALLALLSQE